MIPIRIQFSGVRDFKPTRLFLGEKLDEHTLITGPNGVGKSTISFCMGAILSSSKIELEGLRSNNLPYEKKWRAQLELTFKNEGPSRIDAPRYIAFRLLIEQAENLGALQKEYQVWTGDTLETLTIQDIYRSGDSQQRNFTMYKEDLQYKYKIDPDLFYLIWYQQEVNQFAEMAPQERFRRFSEMHNIDKIQRSWEAAIEKLKEAEAELNSARSVVKFADMNLRSAKQEYDLLKDNQKRLLQHGKQHIVHMLTLVEKYKQQKSTAESAIQEKKEALWEAQKKVNKIQQKLSDNQKKLELLNEQINEQSTLQNEKKSRQVTLQSQKVTLAQSISQLREQLAETETLRNRLRYSEQETKEKQQKSLISSQQFEKTLSAIEQELIRRNQENEQLTNELALIQVELDQLEKAEQLAKTLLQQHGSSPQLKEKIHLLQQEIRKLYKEQVECEQHIDQLRNELTYLKNNELLSERQKDGMKAMRTSNIKAFAFRDLLTLDEKASLKDEHRLNAIKYTIFYLANHFTPINDLYYVSLPKLVPDQLIMSIPSLKLKVRDDISEAEQNYGAKALWWVGQFFAGNYPSIQENTLVDRQGLRGAQEKNTVILNAQAVTTQLKQTETQLHQLEVTAKNLNVTFQRKQQEVEVLYSVLKEVQAAEAKILEADRMNLKRQYCVELKEKKDKIIQQINNLQKEQSQKQLQLSKLTFELNLLQEEIAIYEQLGEVKQIQNTLTEKNKQFTKISSELNDLEFQLVKLQQQISQLNERKQNLNTLNSELKQDEQDKNYEIQGINKSIQKAMEEAEVIDTSILNQQLKLAEIQEIVPDIYDEALQEPLLTSLSVSQLISDDSIIEANFNYARKEKVNPEAERNYYAVKKDYDEKSEAVSKTEEFLALHQERTLEMENRLETTINMNILKINRLFEKYMDEFQFEGKIEYDRFEDKKGRVIFQLFIKVRKIGHSGKLEDVGTKARHGKLGKGVSGGEESLSSLLFALALLQNLNTSPSFIVLDEFDSALDETRKEKVFKLYHSELKRKLIILSPKAHEDQYYANFTNVIVVEHDSTVPISRTKSIQLNRI